MKIHQYIFLVISILSLGACSSTKQSAESNVPAVINSNRSIPQTFDSFEIDKFENVYLIKENQLKKIDQLTANIATYENDRYGEITSIDVTNPQKILVFYQLYDIIVTLDNSLAETSIIDLKRFEYTDINVIAASNDNNIWLYDPVTFTLRKINKNGKVLAESFNLYTLYLDQVDPDILIEHGNKVYMNSPNDGVLVFDNLGQYIKLLPLTSLSDMQVLNGNTIFLNDEGPQSYLSKQLEIVPIKELENLEGYKQLRISKTMFYLGYDDGIDVVKR